MPIIERFKSWRASRGWSQADAAEALGVSQTLVSSIERGDATVTKLELAARIEELSADWSEGPITMREWRDAHPSTVQPTAAAGESAS